MTEFDLDLLSVQFAVRRRFALFLLVSCAVAAFPVWLGRGQRISEATAAAAELPVYRQTAFETKFSEDHLSWK